MTSIPFTDKRWSAHPAPHTPPDITDDKLVMSTNKGTDWWHTLERNSRDGVVYGFEVDVSKGVEISVELDIAHKDRACLWLQLGEDLWVKAGIEFDGQLMAGGVVTYPYSDWSIHPHPGGPLRFSISYHNRKLMIFEDGLMVREVNVFGDGTETKATVGVMACSPLGGDAKASFKGFTLKQGL